MLEVLERGYLMGGYVWSAILGYLLGSLSPASVIAAAKKINLKECGTGNLDATNVSLVLGRKHGVLVMVIDMLKAFLSVRLARFLFPRLAVAGLVAGCSAVYEHVFPVYRKFRGGKGVAAFGGMILAFKPVLFLLLMAVGVIMAFVCDYGVALVYSATLLAPFFAGCLAESAAVFWVILAASLLVMYKHLEDFEKIKNGTQIRTRDYVKKICGRDAQD